MVGEAVLVRATDSIAYYEYDVDGVHHDWNVARNEAPYPVGTRFPIVYVPENPTMSRPGSDRSRGAVEAASNRGSTWKLEAGIFAIFASMFYVARNGPAQAAARSARIIRIAAPLATAAAVLRLIVYMLE